MRYSFIMKKVAEGVCVAATSLPTSLPGAPVAAEERTIHGQPSWIIATDDVELAITKRGGHMAPVTFDRKAGAPIRPYHISPWQDEGLDNLPAAVLVPLRGDFFCMPFGGNAAPLGSERHVIEGFAGPTPLAHHATLAMPEEEGVVRVSTSPFRIGMTCPGVFSDPASKEYQSLASGQTFTDLAHVPSAFKTPADVDCSRFPTRRGYADLLALVADEAKLGGGPAWTAAVNTEDHWAWFAIRDARVLPTTVFWIENHGRHGVPWLGRNNCLGLEDVCGFFADGLVPSIEPNALSKQGVRTAITLDAARPTEIRYAQGAVRVPEGFDEVKTIDFSTPGRIKLIAASGQAVTVPAQHAFVMGESARP